MEVANPDEFCKGQKLFYGQIYFSSFTLMNISVYQPLGYQ